MRKKIELKRKSWLMGLVVAPCVLACSASYGMQTLTLRSSSSLTRIHGLHTRLIPKQVPKQVDPEQSRIVDLPSSSVIHTKLIELDLPKDFWEKTSLIGDLEDSRKRDKDIKEMIDHAVYTYVEPRFIKRHASHYSDYNYDGWTDPDVGHNNWIKAEFCKKHNTETIYPTIMELALDNNNPWDKLKSAEETVEEMIKLDKDNREFSVTYPPLKYLTPGIHTPFQASKLTFSNLVSNCNDWQPYNFIELPFSYYSSYSFLNDYSWGRTFHLHNCFHYVFIVIDPQIKDHCLYVEKKFQGLKVLERNIRVTSQGNKDVSCFNMTELLVDTSNKFKDEVIDERKLWNREGKNLALRVNPSKALKIDMQPNCIGVITLISPPQYTFHPEEANGSRNIKVLEANSSTPTGITVDIGKNENVKFIIHKGVMKNYEDPYVKCLVDPTSE